MSSNAAFAHFFSWKKMRNIILHNWRAKLASLVLGASIWFIIKRHVTVERRTFDFPVPPAAINPK